jgi:hypothetical protein
VAYLAHAQLIADLLDGLTAPARIVLLGSNTYHANVYPRLMGVPAAQWRDPLEIARPASGEKKPGFKATGVAYSNAKLAILYYAHELRRHVAPGISVTAFEPGWMPGTSLGRGMPAAAQAVGRGIGRLPGVATGGTLRPRTGLARPRRRVGAPARRRLRGARQGDRGAADGAGPRARKQAVAGHCANARQSA